MANNPLMDYAGIYGNTSLNMPSSDGWKGTRNVPTDADTGESRERGRPFKKLFGGLRDKLGSMFGKMGKKFDSSSFDVQDPKQVLRLQRKLGLEQDGVYGPITQQAHRQLVDDQRRGEGLDAYRYGNEDEGYTSFDAYGDPVSEPSQAELDAMGGPLNAAANNQSDPSKPWYNNIFGGNTLGAGGYSEAANQMYDDAEEGF